MSLQVVAIQIFLEGKTFFAMTIYSKKLGFIVLFPPIEK